MKCENGYMYLSEFIGVGQALFKCTSCWFVFSGTPAEASIALRDQHEYQEEAT